VKKVKDLITQIESNRMSIAFLKERNTELEAELLALTSSDFAAEMVAREKTHGSISKEIDGVRLTYEVKQTVSWDQDKLRALWEALPSYVGNKLVELKFSVPERMFACQTDSALIDALVDARITKFSAPTIKLQKNHA
jgi:hypothetical protein